MNCQFANVNKESHKRQPETGMDNKVVVQAFKTRYEFISEIEGWI